MSKTKNKRPGQDVRCVQTLLRGLGTHARKGLGQNFLIDQRVLESILEAAELSPDDTVIEVGPGLGMLTRELAGRVGRVAAVELDERLASDLKRKMGNWPNVRIVQGDILRENPESLTGCRPYKVVANLPYNITSPAIRHFLTSSRPPGLMVVMVQKEVADEIAAGPGKMRLLSVMVQFYSEADVVADVTPECFYPAPRVSSSILRLRLRDTPATDIDDPASFFETVASGFRQPRKQISNSLAQGLQVTPLEAAEYLRLSGIDSRRRAETLTIDEWTRLWKVVPQSLK